MLKTVILLCAESAAGKDEIARKLELDNYKILKSYTTRPRRLNELNTHVFINSDEVENYKSDIIAWTKIGEYEYFATKNQLLESDVYIIDPNGVKYLKEKIKDVKFVTIYLNVSEYDRRNRARLRGDNEDVMNRRFIAEMQQFNEFKKNAKFNYSVENYNLDKALKIIKYIIEVETSL